MTLEKQSLKKLLMIHFKALFGNTGLAFPGVMSKTSQEGVFVLH